MQSEPFVSFLLLADTVDGNTTFSARTIDDVAEFIAGPMSSIETERLAARLVGLAQDGFGWQLERLAKHPTGIPHTQARLSCSLQELKSLGFKEPAIR
jgi:hypothetical protein